MDYLKSKLGFGSKATTKSGKPLGIIIAGPPASGKGTQCANIAKEFGVVHISTGDMLRAAKEDVGSDIGAIMNNGGLVPDELVVGLVEQRLQKGDVKTRGFLLDGFPRTKAQAVVLKNVGVEIDVVILLEVPDEKLVARVLGRRIDPVTQKTYNVNDDVPKEVSDRWEQRGDDTEDKLKNRLGEYHKNITPITEEFGEQVRKIDGDMAPADVWKQIQTELRKV